MPSFDRRPALRGATHATRLRALLRSDAGTATLAAISGLALRVAVALAVPTVFTADSPSYLRIASDLVEGRGFADARLGLLRMPGYPVLLAALLALPMTGEMALALGQALLGALATGCAFLVARGLGSSRGGALAVAAFVAALPPYLAFDRAVMSESLALALLLAFSATALRLARRPLSPPLAIAAGLTGAALLLTRLNALPFVLVLPVPTLVAWWDGIRDRRRRDRTVLVALLLSASAAALLAPWVAANGERFGRSTLFASPAKVRLVYAAQHGLIDLERALAAVPAGSATGARPDPAMTLFWNLSRRPAGGEEEARAILEAARSDRPAAFVWAQTGTFLRFLAGFWPDGEPGIWLVEGPSAQRREEGRSRRYLSAAATEPSPIWTAALRRACALYSAARPLLPGALALAALAWLRRPQADLACRSAAAALLAAHLGTALLHASTLADYARFALPFDWVPVALLAAAYPGAVSRPPLVGSTAVA